MYKRQVLQGEFMPADLPIPIGARFNLDKLNYVVIEKVSNGMYKVMCETPGILGNQYLGDLIPIDYISGLELAKLTALLIPGEDEEDTEHLRTRYFESFDSQAFGGNVKAVSYTHLDVYKRQVFNCILGYKNI